MKRKHFPSIFPALVVLLLLSACKDFIEPSIDKRPLTLQAPADDYQSAKYAISFWWNEVDDALGYRLQIVSESFASPGSLIADTVMSGHTFSMNLDPGRYQWRVRAENGSSATAYSTAWSLTVLQSSIKQQAVQLRSPADNFLTNKPLTTFQWNSLYGATRYRIEIDTNNFVNESALVFDQTVPGQQVNFSLPKDITYQWRVRAENDTAQARWSVINQVTLDKTSPGKVTLTAPAGNQIVNNPVSLQWQALTGAAKYKLYILKADSTSNFNQNFPVIVTNTSYAFSAAATGSRVYWKVSAIDAAGNEGDAGQVRSFTVQ